MAQNFISPIPMGNVVNNTPPITQPSAFTQAAGNIRSLIGNIFNPAPTPQQIRTPLPQYNTLVNNPGLSAYMQRESNANSINPQQAMQTLRSTPPPQPIQYNQNIANNQRLPLQIQQPPQQSIMQTIKDLPTVIKGVPQNFLQTLNSQVLPITRQFGIPDAVVAAQAAHESGYGQSPAAKNLNNLFGLMHFNPQTGQRSIHSFASPQQAATFYAQTVQSLVPNLAQIKNNPQAVLQALQSGKQRYEADNPNPQQYVYDVTQNPLWQAYGGGQPLATNPNGWAK